MKSSYHKVVALIMFVTMVSFFSCEQESSNDKKLTTQQFYDLKGYFETEARRLSDKGGSVIKVVKADGKTEEKVVGNIDFKRELDFFAGSDINRPAWSDKYIADTMFNELKEIVQLRYQANDEKLKVRKIVIEFDNSKISKIDIKNNTSNSIATSSQVLIYEPSTGYSIESHQEVAMGDAQLFKIEVRF